MKDISPFADGLRALIGVSPVLADKPLEVALVINPRAGGFTNERRFGDAVQAIQNALGSLAGFAARQKHYDWRLRYTEGPRHASQLAAEFLDEAAMKHGRSWLVMIASGDGTSHEFLDALSRAPAELRERFTVLRLPMGTGNDGSDGHSMEESLRRLGPDGRVATQPALRVIPNPQGPAASAAPEGEWRSFNIASIGLDAFVTQQTNKLKANLPGDFYKLWLDVASILYDRIYPSADMLIVAKDEKGTELARYEGRFLLTAMGISGHRRYGANKPILPDDDNVCAIRQMPLLRKLALKGPIAKGGHRKFPEALLFSASELDIQYGAEILVQMDGEAHPLCAADFPLRIARTEPLVRYLGLRG